jgi:hypothetical protein
MIVMIRTEFPLQPDGETATARCYLVPPSGQTVGRNGLVPPEGRSTKLYGYLFLSRNTAGAPPLIHS